MTWTIVFANRPDFDAFVKKLPKDQRRLVAAGLFVRLATLGPDVCKTSSGKALGGNLYELRIKKDPSALIRVFFALHRNRVVVILGGYNKKADPSERRQAQEIRDARDAFDDWRARNTSEKR